jgi:hypothetical protein
MRSKDLENVEQDVNELKVLLAIPRSLYRVLLLFNKVTGTVPSKARLCVQQAGLSIT